MPGVTKKYLIDVVHPVCDFQVKNREDALFSFLRLCFFLFRQFLRSFQMLVPGISLRLVHQLII